MKLIKHSMKAKSRRAFVTAPVWGAAAMTTGVNKIAHTQPLPIHEGNTHIKITLGSTFQVKCSLI